MRRHIGIEHFRSLRLVAVVILVIGMLLGATACDYEVIIRPKDPEDSTVDGSGQSEKQTDENGEYVSSDENEEESEEGRYSKILQNVLDNEYYNNLIDTAKAGNPDLYESAKFAPHPYGFLEDEGYDVEAIKNGEIECLSHPFVIQEEPNSLYIMVRTSTDATVYTHYLIKYDLTDKEMEDYQMVHEKSFIQACFMNDMISQMKTPTVISEEKLTVKAGQNLMKALKQIKYMSQKLAGENVGGFVLQRVDVDAGEFDILLFSTAGTDTSMVGQGFVNTITLTTGSKFVAQDSNDVFTKPSNLGEFNYKETDNKAKTMFVYRPDFVDLATRSKDLDG